MTKEQAITLYESGFWKEMSYREIAEYQITTKRLCMPFETFHEAIEKTLNRPVYTYEFGMNIDGLKAELFKGAKPPTFEEIINLIPKDKQILILA